MKKKKVLSFVLLYQVTGFLLLIMLIWISELFDLPHNLMGMPKTPFNLTECLYESIVIGLFGITVILLTQKTIGHIRYLEGFLPVCSFCKKIRIQDEWIPLEEYLNNHGEVQFSHSFCPSCAEKHYGGMFHKAEK